ncbi:hypothetical protein RZS08_16275, partial [Arthrospira platensis SPKY1]|nr:hypothetical protein [Arthrospira platensis SPKY1]
MLVVTDLDHLVHRLAPALPADQVGVGVGHHAAVRDLHAAGDRRRSPGAPPGRVAANGSPADQVGVCVGHRVGGQDLHAG